MDNIELNQFGVPIISEEEEARRRERAINWRKSNLLADGRTKANPSPYKYNDNDQSNTNLPEKKMEKPITKKKTEEVKQTEEIKKNDQLTMF